MKTCRIENVKEKNKLTCHKLLNIVFQYYKK